MYCYLSGKHNDRHTFNFFSHSTFLICFSVVQKLDPMLFHHVFALTATIVCTKISRSTQEVLPSVAWCEYGISVCDLLTILC